MSAPVFVVGAPRSGTTMLAAMLASHSRFAAGPETQFFSKLSDETLRQAIEDRDWPRKAVGDLTKLTLADQPVAALFESSAEGLRSYLEARPPSIAAMMEALTVPLAAKRGKPRWVEKTPNHILHLPAIRRHWPDARIVRIIRDPRDAALSTCRLPTFSNSTLANIYLWRRWHDVGEAFIGQDANSYTLRYCSIIADPEGELAALCAFLGVEFEPAMLEFQRHAAEVSSKQETWKRGVSAGLEKDRVFAWRRTLPDELRPICDMVTYEWLQRFGYECSAEPRITRRAYRMSRAYVESHEALLLSDANRGVRWLPTDDPWTADKIVDSPRYARFRNPRLIARLIYGRGRDRVRTRLERASTTP